MLQNHGYLEVDSLVQRRRDQLPGLLPNPLPPRTPPFPVWLDEAGVRVALEDSGKRRILFGHR